ncbi:hypothetical protein [Thalassotalea profundi]|uniref:Uncharacterized protein n=1 Tax=Thalassotalea profundi TaxID=2036687 RepID=A0ABQ3IEW9_9GAMM|nr:hypothetical protein [Thalassotalea profundi]GHE78451.1 hypothetical protein GCM10011501_02830 [Thalassotalea profundi]
MTYKKRKISLVTRVNVDEHQIISDACKTANYNTIGSFIRDTLICSLTEEDSLHGITVPTQTAEEMANNVRLLNQLIEHLNLALSDKSLFDSHQDKEQYLINAIQMAYLTGNALQVWSHFLKKNFDESIKQIALSNLSADELNDLASQKSCILDEGN